MWYWQRDRWINQWNRIEHLEISPHRKGQIIFNEGTKNNSMEKVQSFQKKMLEQIGLQAKKKKKKLPKPQNLKISSKSFINLNVINKSIKLLEEKIGELYMTLGLAISSQTWH